MLLLRVVELPATRGRRYTTIIACRRQMHFVQFAIDLQLLHKCTILENMQTDVDRLSTVSLRIWRWTLQSIHASK